MGKKSGGVRIKQVGGMKPPSKAALASMVPPKLEDFMVPPDEQISLPPPMNKKYQMFYPIHETFTMQTDKFQIIYPSYIDPTKTIQQGRRVPLHLLVDEDSKKDASMAESNYDDDNNNNNNVHNTDDLDGETENDVVLSPTIQEISQVLQGLQIRHVIQPYKCYSRCDPYENPGRCLVDIRTHYRTKYELLVVVARELHKLPSRPARLEQERLVRRERQQLSLSVVTTEVSTTTLSHPNSAAGTMTSSTTTTSSSNKKKSSKKKK